MSNEDHPAPDARVEYLAHQLEQLQSALNGANDQIVQLRAVLSRMAPDQVLPFQGTNAKLDHGTDRAGGTPPPAEADWWKQAGVVSEAPTSSAAQSASDQLPSYFGLEGAWVPGNMVEVDNLDEVLSEVDLEETYAKLENRRAP